MQGYNVYGNGYSPYGNQYVQPYPDRLSQLQNNYSQAVPQAAQPQMQQGGQFNQGLLWVQGEAGAKAYLTAPNTTVLLMDSENERFYIKSTDGAGMPNLRIFEYKEMMPNRTPAEPQQVDMGEYVTRDEFEKLKLQNEDILRRMETLINSPVQVADNRPVSRPQSRTAKKGGESDE